MTTTNHTASKCKPGGCSSIGCEGGHYCFNADGTSKKAADPNAVRAALAEALARYAPASPIGEDAANGAMGERVHEWAPARIWLQREQGEGGSHTWCEDSVGDGDLIEEVEYVRVALTAEKVAAPYAYEIGTPDRTQQLVYPAYLERYATDEERALPRLPLYTAPQPAQTQAALTVASLQQKAIDHGFKYWRAPDAHGVTGTNAQAVELLQDLLGVEVEIAAHPESGGKS